MSTWMHVRLLYTRYYPQLLMFNIKYEMIYLWILLKCYYLQLISTQILLWCVYYQTMLILIHYTYFIMDKFTKEIICLHGIPLSIVYNRDVIFTSHFWFEFFKLQGIIIKYSNHIIIKPNTQIEVVNRCLEFYL